MTTWTFTAHTTLTRGPWVPGHRRRWPSTLWERPLSRAAWRPEGPSRGGSVTPPTLPLDQCASLKSFNGSPPSRWGLSFCQGATTTTAVSRRLCVFLCVWVGSFSQGVQRFKQVCGRAGYQLKLFDTGTKALPEFWCRLI